MSLLGAARYGVDQAPGGISVVQELLNTTSKGKPRLPDLLGEGALASEWLQEVRGAAMGGASQSSLAPLRETDLRRLRALREAVVASVTGSPAAGIRTDVELSMDAAGLVDVVHPERPVAWILSTVMVEALLAQRSGDWRRLKICANPDCDLSFFDRSRNRSGVWHDVHVCGNAINLRASRSRRRAGTSAANS
ncbi:CGNR zinc finger domain-containing protein [Streptomyces sp. NPDC007088]|uniref:CGNR zinc finger domain-containing protein n=1 Tax=Streptomyces sp. NPDC007088 TaxID=3364773 RepID=UPI00367A6411